MKAERSEDAAEGESEAGWVWFMRCGDRSCLHNIALPGGAAGAEGEAAAGYPEGLAKIIAEGGYCKQYIFSVDGADLHWKKMPLRTFIAREEKSMPSFKPSKDRLTLVRG